MNYRPDRAARALATGRTGMIALWMEDFRQPYTVSVVDHVAERFGDPSFELVIRTMTYGDRSPETVSQWQVDGILVMDGVDYVRRLFERGVPDCPPLVAMGDDPGVDVDYVGVDLRVGATEAVRHLLDVGCRRVAFLTNTWGDRREEPRYAAYLSVLQEAGLSPEVIVVPGITRSATRQVMREYVQCEGSPDGIFCLSDSFAIAAYRALYDLGIRVPDDMAIVGCDGLEEGEYLERPLTTIVQPFDEMAAMAWQFLRRRMADRSLPRQRGILSAHLAVRESSRYRHSG
jgi:LacI family transcriptional regulator